MTAAASPRRPAPAGARSAAKGTLIQRGRATYYADMFNWPPHRERASAATRARSRPRTGRCPSAPWSTWSAEGRPPRARADQRPRPVQARW